MYNEGWALTHMLQLSPDYASKYAEFLRAVQSGTDSAAALEKVYGKSVSTIEKDLQFYIRGFQFYGRLFPVKLASAKDNFPATPAPMFDVRLALADLTNRPDKEEETRGGIGDRRGDPKRPEPWAGLGNLAWRRGQTPAAVEAFGKAYELGDRDGRFLWDFGRLAERDHPDAALSALMDLFKQEPDRLAVRMELAALNLNARRPGGALSVLADVKNITSEDAPRFFTLLANTQIQLNDRVGARVTVAKLAANAKTAADKAQVDRMQSYLDQADAPRQATNRNPVATNAPDQAPRLTRPPLRAEQPVLPPPAPQVEGSFVQIRLRR